MEVKASSALIGRISENHLDLEDAKRSTRNEVKRIDRHRNPVRRATPSQKGDLGRSRRTENSGLEFEVR
jgi:hypothetical protein